MIEKRIQQLIDSDRLDEAEQSIKDAADQIKNNINYYWAQIWEKRENLFGAKACKCRHYYRNKHDNRFKDMIENLIHKMHQIELILAGVYAGAEETVASDERIALYTELSYLYVVQDYQVEAYLLSQARGKLFHIKNNDINNFNQSRKIEAGLASNSHFFVFLESADENQIKPELLAHAAATFTETVYFINLPVDCPVDGLDFDKEDLLRVIMGNCEVQGGVTYITPPRLICDDGRTLDTTKLVLWHLAQDVDEEKRCVLLAEEQDKFRFQEAGLTAELSERMSWEVLSVNHSKRDDNLSMYWLDANFYKKYSKPYGFDIKKTLDAPPTCKISIVIPTRNCPDTLRYTLLSCLDQDYEDYEIVLSDNGEPGDSSVFDLTEEFNAKCVAEGRSPKIRYFHTPSLLPLSKSFEYAYLQAKGEFLFGMGSDDAVMPGGLRILAQCIDAYPMAEVIQWVRHTYYWPDIPIGLADMILYTANCGHKVGRLPCDGLFRMMQRQEINLYKLPFCYINSGMRRSYMKRIIEETGTLIGGACQDIYLAAVNLYLLKDVVFIDSPLTIAGQGSRSIGLKSTLGHQTEEEKRTAIEDWKKITVKSEARMPSQELLPVANWDTALFYNQILRVRDLKVGSLQGDDEIDFKWLFAGSLLVLNPEDIDFQWHIDQLVLASEKHGRTFKRWFEPLAEKRRRDQTTNKSGDSAVAGDVPNAQNAPDAGNTSEKTPAAATAPKTYTEQTEPDAGGYVVLDASNYGVSDIYAATKLIDRLLNAGQ